MGLFPMTGFELWTSGIGNDRSTKWATTTATIYFVSFQSTAHIYNNFIFYYYNISK